MPSDLVSRPNDLLCLDAAADPDAPELVTGIEEELCELYSPRRVGELQPGSPSAWSTSVEKRLFDIVCVIPALLFLLPAILIISAMVWATSDGPIFFQQLRMGKNRQRFTIYKFRTMFHRRSAKGPGVTKAGDPRLTSLGIFLRKHKLDEIPQLYNVLRGDMSLVGPRPKLPEFEYLGMKCRPGITGAATLAFAREEEMLSDIPSEELDRFHLAVLSPMKKELDSNYQRNATFVSDLGLLFRTLLKKRYPSVSPKEEIALREYAPGPLPPSGIASQDFRWIVDRSRAL